MNNAATNHDDHALRLYMCDLWTVLQLRRSIEDSDSAFDIAHAEALQKPIVARMQRAWATFNDAQRAELRARRAAGQSI